MSERIVLLLQNDPPPEPAVGADPAPAGNGQAARVATRLMVREPEGHVGMWSFGCLGDEEVFAALASGANNGDVVAAAGRRLFGELVAKPGVSAVLVAALQVPADQRRPVYIDVTGADACQELPWEALCTDDGRFLALDRWPVARMLASTAGAVTTRILRPPLRIAAILSCLRVDPRGEWDALRRAVESSQVAVNVLLLLSDYDLYDELVALPLPWLDVAMIPVDYPDLQASVTAFEPQVLHFFCHGDTSGGPHPGDCYRGQCAGTRERKQIPAGGARDPRPRTAAEGGAVGRGTQRLYQCGDQRRIGGAIAGGLAGPGPRPAGRRRHARAGAEHRRGPLHRRLLPIAARRGTPARRLRRP